MARADSNNTTKLSSLFGDPFLRTAFAAAEDDGSASMLVAADGPRTLEVAPRKSPPQLMANSWKPIDRSSRWMRKRPLLHHISDDDRYEHQGYLAAGDARFEAIALLSETPASSWKGGNAKAAAIKMRQVQHDYE